MSEAEGRGVPGVERMPEGPPAPDRIGTGERMGDPATVPDPAEVEVPPEFREELERLMALYPDRRSAAIPALHAAQARYGWCSPEALRQVATVMQVTPSYLSSVASFLPHLIQLICNGEIAPGRVFDQTLPIASPDQLGICGGACTLR